MKKLITAMALMGLGVGLAAGWALAQETDGAAPASQPNWQQQASDLRAQIWAKRGELRRLQAQEPPPVDQIATLQQEIDRLCQQRWELNRQNVPAGVVGPCPGWGLGLGLGYGPGIPSGQAGSWGQGPGPGLRLRDGSCGFSPGSGPGLRRRDGSCGYGPGRGQRLRLRDGSCGFSPGSGRGRGGWGRGRGWRSGACPWAEPIQ